MDKIGTSCPNLLFHAFTFPAPFNKQGINQYESTYSYRLVLRIIVQHPRSPWWISNARIADYCKIRDDDMTHNTSILGKYLPRRQAFWERAAGLSVLHQ